MSEIDSSPVDVLVATFLRGTTPIDTWIPCVSESARSADHACARVHTRIFCTNTGLGLPYKH